MCGRYYVAIDDQELQDICDAAMRQEKEDGGLEQLEIKLSGEIFPTDVVPVSIGTDEFRFMRWGFSGIGSSGGIGGSGNGSRPLINARSETALSKPTFQESMRERRCLIPASGYYEWKKEDGRKIKHRFYLDGQPLYFAGCWRQEKDERLPRFTILTRTAAPALEAIHDRMPVIIPQDRAEQWLYEGAGVLDSAVTDLLVEVV